MAQIAVLPILISIGLLLSAATGLLCFYLVVTIRLPETVTAFLVSIFGIIILPVIISSFFGTTTVTLFGGHVTALAVLMGIPALVTIVIMIALNSLYTYSRLPKNTSEDAEQLPKSVE